MTAAKRGKPPAAVAALVAGYVGRGVFAATALPPGRDGSEAFRLVWFRRREMTLAVDRRRATARLIDVLPPVVPRSALDRQLRAWLRLRAAPDLPAHRRVDPALFGVALSKRDGRMTLAVTSAAGDAVAAARKLVQVTNELYLDFLAAPERYDWIVASFDLDPDSPRWP